MARKDVNIVTSLVGKGLEREALLLRELLATHDVYTNFYHYCNYAGSNFVRADINLFLEVMMPNVLTLSRENWLFPNDEWWNSLNDQFLPRITKVCCKTQDSYRHWCQKVDPAKCVYVGFEARDLYHPEIPRENKFLHLAGGSEFKNTEAVIQAWKNGNWAYKPFPLTVVTLQKKWQALCEDVDNVTWIPRVNEDELVQLMNSHRFHLMPSAYEGFGHAIHEGLGCGALVLTTDAPPMNEFDGIVTEWKIPVVSQTPRSLAQLNQVSLIGVQAAVCKAIETTSHPNELERRSCAAREAFLNARKIFRQKFLSMVGVA